MHTAYLKKSGTRIKTRRLERGLTQPGVGINRDNCADRSIERRQLIVSVSILKKISGYTGISLSHLLDF